MCSRVCVCACVCLVEGVVHGLIHCVVPVSLLFDKRYAATPLGTCAEGNGQLREDKAAADMKKVTYHSTHKLWCCRLDNLPLARLILSLLFPTLEAAS